MGSAIFMEDTERCEPEDKEGILPPRRGGQESMHGVHALCSHSFLRQGGAAAQGGEWWGQGLHRMGSARSGLPGRRNPPWRPQRRPQAVTEQHLAASEGSLREG